MSITMNAKRKRRLMMVGLLVVGVGIAAALALSGMPFNGPIGAARVGYKDGEYLLNAPGTGLSETTDLDTQKPF